MIELSRTKELVERARGYLAANAAESGADVLIGDLVKEVTTLEQCLRMGVGAVLNDLIAAGMAHIHPVSGEISLTPQGKILIERTRDFERRSGSNN